MSTDIFHFLLDIAAERHPALFESIKALGPVTLAANNSEPFGEKLCRSVAGQQLSIKAAQTIWSRVLDSANSPDLMVYLEQATPQQLRACGLSAAKSKAVQGIAQQIRQGHLDCAALSQMSAAERENTLIKLWGVGKWTIDMMNIFYYAEPDIWPDNDVTACKTLLKLAGEQHTSFDVASHYAPYRSFLALYMYQIADAAPS